MPMGVAGRPRLGRLRTTLTNLRRPFPLAQCFGLETAKLLTIGPRMLVSVGHPPAVPLPCLDLSGFCTHSCSGKMAYMTKGRAATARWRSLLRSEFRDSHTCPRLLRNSGFGDGVGNDCDALCVQSGYPLPSSIYSSQRTGTYSPTIIRWLIHT